MINKITILNLIRLLKAVIFQLFNQFFILYVVSIRQNLFNLQNQYHLTNIIIYLLTQKCKNYNFHHVYLSINIEKITINNGI